MVAIKIMQKNLRKKMEDKKVLKREIKDKKTIKICPPL